MIKHPEIYKFDTKGKARVWFIEQDPDLPRYRTVAGLLDGNLVTSEWTGVEGNLQRPDALDQTAFEIASAYEHKLTREYHRSLDEAKGGAHYFKPMLAQKYEAFTCGYVQPKLDGIRCIATVRGLFSRQGKPIISCPHIIDQLAPLFDDAPELILDGELYNHELRDDFNTIVSLVKKQKPTSADLEESANKIEYHIYDVPSAPYGFEDRNNTLRALEMDQLNSPSIKWVPAFWVDIPEEYDDWHVKFLHEGYEGSMWRCHRTPYEQKRSKALLKRKDFQDEEFEIIAIEEGKGNWSGLAKRVVCRLPDGRQFGAGIEGSMERASKLLREKHNVVTVRYFERTPDGIPRFPVAVKFHGEERTL